MKKIKNIASWVSFFVTVAVVSTLAIYLGAWAANWVKDLFNIEGWWLLLLVPIVAAVGLAVLRFFMLGIELVVRENAYRFN